MSFFRRRPRCSTGFLGLAVALLITLLSVGAHAAPFGLKCQLSETQDHFVFYPQQLVYQSDQFALFHNFKGRVVTQVDLKTQQMVRTTYLGEEYSPRYQILFGECNKVNHTLSLWTRDENPIHTLQ